MTAELPAAHPAAPAPIVQVAPILAPEPAGRAPAGPPPAIPARSLAALVVRFRAFLTYTVVGGVAVLIDVGLFWLLAGALGLPPIVANVVSTAVAVLYSFAANSLLTFRVRDRLLRRFLSFSAVSAIGLGVSTLMLWLLADIAGLDALVVKVVSLPVVLVIQYLLNSRITFAPRSTS